MNSNAGSKGFPEQNPPPPIRGMFRPFPSCGSAISSQDLHSYQQKRALEGHVPALRCFRPEVAHLPSTHGCLTRRSHMALPH